jgi:G3E family GTPase
VRLGFAEHILRAKGVLDVVGAKGPLVVHGVHHVMHAPVELADWRAMARYSRLVLIVDVVIANTIRESWEKAVPGLSKQIAA